MKRAQKHWMRIGLAALAVAAAGGGALAYEKGASAPRDVLIAEEDAGMGIDFIITGPTRRGVAEPAPAKASTASADKPAVRHRMRRN